MENDKIIKRLRIHYFAMLAVVLVMILFLKLYFKESAAGVLPETMYIVQVFVIMFTLIAISVAIKGFTWYLERVKELPEELFVAKFFKGCIHRTNFLFCVLAVNAIAYCMIGYEGALYCGLLGLGAMIYSFPTKRDLELYLNDREK